MSQTTSLAAEQFHRIINNVKIDELKLIISEFNNDTLPELLPRREQTDQGPLTDSETASIAVPLVNFPLFCGRDCFCGRTSKGYTSSRSFVETCITLSELNSPSSGCSVAVGAVIDDQTSASTEDLPVILAVGINYGQGVHYANNSVPLVDPTRMRPRLKNAFISLKTNDCPIAAEALGDNFHLVAANFFPWITGQSWSAYGFNGIEEATLIHCCGHSRPEEYIADLVSRIQPHTVVFHGANNAVPYLGGCVVRECLNDDKGTQVDVIFCDNLAPGNQPAVSNAIKLGCCKRGRSALSITDFDE